MFPVYYWRLMILDFTCLVFTRKVMKNGCNREYLCNFQIELYVRWLPFIFQNKRTKPNTMHWESLHYFLRNSLWRSSHFCMPSNQLSKHFRYFQATVDLVNRYIYMLKNIRICINIVIHWNSYFSNMVMALIFLYWKSHRRIQLKKKNWEK